MDENKGKILIAGSLLLCVLAGVILFLFVVPGLNGTGQSLAQGGPPPGGPGGPPPGGPGGPGGPPPGGPGGPGDAGAMGGPMAGTPVAAAPIKAVPALEGSRPNPFLPTDIEGEDGAPAKVPYADRYGVNWHQLPITARLGFVRPQVPGRAAVAPPKPTEEPTFDIAITSILWTQDGQAMAVYESGSKSGVVKPGDIVGDWQVAEIWRDRVIVSDRKTGRQQAVYLTSKAPAASKPSTGTRPATPGGTGGRSGRRPGAPAAPGGLPAAPGMPPPVR